MRLPLRKMCIRDRSRLKNAGYRIVIAGLRPHICKIFKLTAMDSIFSLEEDDEKQV